MNKPFNIPPLLSPAMATRLLEAIDAGREKAIVTLDLGISETEVAIGKQGVSINGTRIPPKRLEKIVKRGNAVFAVDEKGPYAVEIRDDDYYKLVPAESGYGPPHLEISGIKMHRTLGIDPYEDARTKVAAVVAATDTVLDTCGGLGYTAIFARRQGAAEVISVEKNPSIIALQRYNPWSSDYLNDEGIERIEGDAAAVINEFDSGYFDCIMHDPPRFTLAEELYGGAFLEALRDRLRSGGLLAFYTGEPYRASKGTTFVDNLVKRLRALQMQAAYDEKIQCIVAEKKG